MSLSIGGSVSVGGVASAAAGVGMAASALATGRMPASIRCIELTGPPGFILFDFNPDKLTVKRTVTVNSRPSAGGGAASPGGSSGPIAQQVKTPDITISDIIFEGILTKIRCDTLFHWQSPPSGGAAAGLSLYGVPQTNPPKVTFQWGPPMVGFMYDAMITSVTVNYERFTPMGIPIRAKVTLNLQQVVSDWADLPTNPTSGGLAGRRSHVVRDGDSLQSIANHHYGTPGAWRRVAAMNRIDNPSRLRPGTRVYLPNPDELAEGAT
ncbi:MAG: LysM peptidoglycan-binding domain-containing protein [Jatrophihabitans sp.]